MEARLIDGKLVIQVLTTRSAIYDQFHGSSAGPAFFFKPENKNTFAAYYTAMYLIQDTGESIMTHMTKGFSASPMQAYIEFWGVMQALAIQQDAISELHLAVLGLPLKVPTGSAWHDLRETRHACAGHPANRSRRLPAPQRTFMGRDFGNYDSVMYELYDANTGQITHPRFNLKRMIDLYSVEAEAALRNVLSVMKARWP